MQNSHEHSEAIILAAGFGTRLMPITKKIPKPLLDIGNIRIIDHQIFYYKMNGFDKIIINIHHLSEKLRAHVGNGTKYGVSVKYSHEKEILGTGGGIEKMQHMITTDDFPVINSDILIDANIKSIMETHIKSGAIATMVLRPLNANETYTPIDVSRDNNITSIGRGNFSFTGLHVINKRLLSFANNTHKLWSITDAYVHAIEQGEIVAAYIHDSYWMDIGTPDKLNQAKQDIKNGRFTPIYKTIKG